MRILVFALLWWIVSDGTGSWTFGIPVIALATYASYRLQPSRSTLPRPLATLRFLGFFLFQSLHAGVDVARRALGPGMRLAPALIEYRSRLPSGAPRVLLVDTLNLLPGTLTAELRDDIVCLHVLDANLPIEAEVQAVERHIAAVFGIGMKTP